MAMSDILSKEEIDTLLEELLGTNIDDDDESKLYYTLCDMRAIYIRGIDLIENFLLKKCDLWKEGDVSSLPADEIYKHIKKELNDANEKVIDALDKFFENETETVNGHIRIKGEKPDDELSTNEFNKILSEAILKEKDNKDFDLEDFANKTKTI